MELAKYVLKKINEYDYDKMIKDFKLKENIENIKRKHYSNLLNTNKNYSNTVIEMTERMKTTENAKIENYKKEINSKNKTHLKNQEQRRNMLTINNIELKKRKEKEVNTRKKLLENLDEYEKKRKKEEQRTQERLIRFTTLSRNQKNDRHKQFEIKTNLSNRLHLRNLELLNKNEVQVIKNREQRIFQKYTKYFWRKKDKLRANSNNNSTLPKVQSYKEEEEQKFLERQKLYKKKLNDMTIKRIIFQEKKKNDYNLIIKKENSKLQKIKENLELAKIEDDKNRSSILEYQKSIIFKQTDRNEFSTSKRLHSKEDFASNQLIIESKINEFNKDINHLKDNSILKKNIEERKKIYKNLIKEQNEKKKRELEEKEIK